MNDFKKTTEFEKNNVTTESTSLKIFKFTDDDGDKNIGIEIGPYTVFATEQISGSWTVNFALTGQLKSYTWMDTLTGEGAFKTMLLLKPALQKIISELENDHKDWFCACDARRAKLYSRYIPANKIKITED